MPDESTNPVGTTQTSQNDQITTNQPGDDFVLDFGEEENNEQKNEVEINNLGEEKGQEESKINNDFDNDKEITNDSKENDESQDKNINSEKLDDDFNISLDSIEEEGDGEEAEEVGDVEEAEEAEEVGDVEEAEEVGDVEEAEEAGEAEEVGDNQKLDIDEIFLPDDNDSNREINQNDEDKVNSNELEHLQEEKDNIFNDPKENSNNIYDTPKESFNNENYTNLGQDENETIQGNGVMNNDSVINTTQEPLNQPEIGDLLGNSSNDLFVQEPKTISTEPETVNVGLENVHMELENPEIGNLKQEQSNIQGNTNFVLENSENSNISENLPDNNVENQSFTLDYTNTNESENGTEETSNENIGKTNYGEISMEPEESNIITNQIENTNQVESQQISTLSLDQILDTELNSNPQFSDNSKAVPTNVSTNKGFFNKKTLGVIAGIGLFLLAGVAVVFYPSVASNNKPITDSDQIVEEYVDDYQVTDPIEDLEDSDTYENSQLEEDSQLEEPVHGSNITIQQEDFPDADWEDNDESDYEFGDVEPYVSDGYDYFNAGDDNQTEELEIGDIYQVILEYKSQAEVYYNQGDYDQDKKLIKYSAQAIHLCEEYELQVENGESLDEESFSSFKSKIEKILRKIEEYLGGESYNELSQNDYYYDF